MPAPRTLILGLSLAVGLSAPALAADRPTTRVVSCRAGSCLQISGRRDSPVAVVLVNGHQVAATGQRSWRVEVPVETVRAWSEPHARAIDVAVFDPVTQQKVEDQARLPIGLLGGNTELAALVISLK